MWFLFFWINRIGLTLDVTLSEGKGLPRRQLEDSPSAWGAPQNDRLIAGLR